MKCSCLGYDQGIILLNVLQLCLSAAATGLLGYEKPPDVVEASVKLTVTLGILICCMLANLIMVARTLLCSDTRIHLLLRLLMSTVGLVLLIACAAFVIEAILAEEDDMDNVNLWTIASLVIVNAFLYLLDCLVILRFYLYTIFRDEGDY